MPSHDRWDARAAVEAAIASDAPAPEEPGGLDLLRSPVPYGAPGYQEQHERFTRFWQMRDRVLAHSPRSCRVCGATFVAGIVSCVTCLTCKQEKRQRCKECDRVFTVETHLVKRCPRCRSDRRQRDVVGPQRKED